MVASIIEDDVAFGPENLGLSPQEIRERVDWALQAVGMKAYAKETPFRLSGGQKQRVAIAGVLALKPRVMVLDESTAMLDPMGRQEVLEVVKKLQREEKISVVLITHFIEEALLADRVLILENGQLLKVGGREILADAELLTPIGLGVPFAVRIAGALRKRGIEIPEGILDTEELVSLLGGSGCK